MKAFERSSKLAPIPLCVPELGTRAWDYVKACLDSNWVSSAGPFVEKFEHMVADYVGARHAVAVINGTAALHTALLAAGVEPDDEVLVSTLTFIAPANAVRHAGAWPVFIDAEPDYWQMDPQRVADFLTRSCRWQKGRWVNQDTGRRVRALLPVHVLGHPADMPELLTLARKFDLLVVEDAAESLGAMCQGWMAGQMGDLGCFSFNGNKIITTGGGGVIVTNSQELARRARYLTTQAKKDGPEYIHGEVGYNYRLSGLQAALGCAQMEVLDEHIYAKRNMAQRYQEELDGLPGIVCMREAPWAFSTYWLNTILVQEASGMTGRGLLQALAERGIEGRPMWQPLHRSPAFAKLPRVECPVADRLYREAVCLPSSVGLGELQERVIAELRGLLPGAVTQQPARADASCIPGRAE